MDNPLKPTYRELERNPDQLELEYDADPRLMTPDRSHEPLDEFTKDSLMIAGSAPVVIKASKVVKAEFKLVWEDEKPAEPEPEPTANLFESTVRAVDWLADPETRKVARARIADENADLQVAHREGRSALIVWRKLELWWWLVELVANPIFRRLRKVPLVVWRWIIWLFTMPPS